MLLLTYTPSHCPVIAFMLNQASGSCAPLVGAPGRVHRSCFHDDREPDRKLGMDELFVRVFGR